MNTLEEFHVTRGSEFVLYVGYVGCVGVRKMRHELVSLGQAALASQTAVTAQRSKGTCP